MLITRSTNASNSGTLGDGGIEGWQEEGKKKGKGWPLVNGMGDGAVADTDEPGRHAQPSTCECQRFPTHEA